MDNTRCYYMLGKVNVTKFSRRFGSLEQDEKWSNYRDMAGQYCMSHHYQLGLYFWWWQSMTTLLSSLWPRLTRGGYAMLPPQIIVTNCDTNWPLPHSCLHLMLLVDFFCCRHLVCHSHCRRCHWLLCNNSCCSLSLYTPPPFPPHFWCCLHHAPRSVGPAPAHCAPRWHQLCRATTISSSPSSPAFIVILPVQLLLWKGTAGHAWVLTSPCFPARRCVFRPTQSEEGCDRLCYCYAALCQKCLCWGVCRGRRQREQDIQRESSGLCLWARHDTIPLVGTLWRRNQNSLPKTLPFLGKSIVRVRGWGMVGTWAGHHWHRCPNFASTLHLPSLLSPSGRLPAHSTPMGQRSAGPQE